MVETRSLPPRRPRSRSPTPTGPNPRPSSVLRENDSPSPQVQSSEAETLPSHPSKLGTGSSQAETEFDPFDPTTDEELGYTSEGDKILPKGKLRSLVWDHFQKIQVKGTNLLKARCLYCKKKLVGAPKSGTTHLADHIRESCTKKKMLDRGQQFITPTIFTGGGKKVNLQAYSYDPEVARKHLAFMIIMHEYPLSIVEHLGFRRFCHSLQPAFHVVSRKTIKKDIMKVYNVEKVKTMLLMERNRSRVSLTTDMWTASNQKRGFMVVTAHFIDDSWKLQSRILRFAYVPCPHTGDNLSEVLMNTFLEWNIDRKLNTLTVDNCSTNDSMINLLLDKFGDDHIRCKDFFHVRCAAHILNLIVQVGMDVIKPSIEKVRNSVAYWTATPKREEKFTAASRQIGISCGKKLSLDCPTRWNSTFLMLRTAIEYRRVFARLQLKESQYKSCPTDNDWDLAATICERLELFYRVTLLFSGTSYPTSNLFFPEVCDIKIRLSEWENCGIFEVEKMTFEMVDKYDKYWDNTHGFLAVAVVLDPRFKMSLIEYYYKRIYGEERGEKMKEEVQKRCYDLLTLYQGKNNEDNNECSSSRQGVNGPSTYLRSTSTLSDYEVFLQNLKRTKTVHSKSELDHYLEEEQLPRSEKEEFDILAWWKSNGLKYPTLQAIARDVLVVPVSTVASESSFSTGGRVVSSSRNRLHPTTLEALMCSQSWLAAFEDREIPTINDEDKDVDNDESMSDVTTIED